MVSGMASSSDWLVHSSFGPLIVSTQNRWFSKPGIESALNYTQGTIQVELCEYPLTRNVADGWHRDVGAIMNTSVW